MTVILGADYIPLTLTRGSDLERRITFDPAWGNITGWTFDVLEVLPADLDGEITCTVTDGPAGVATLAASWGASWPSGTGLAKVTFYVRPSARDEALPQFRIKLE